MRLFCAVEISHDLREAARLAAAPLRATGAGVKWAGEDALHLTLAFLGEIGEERVPAASEALAAAAAKVPAFGAAFGAYGAFPDADHPKVIWLGLSRGEEELTRLADALRAELSSRKLPFDEKPFKAHLTLGRVRRPGGLKELKEKMDKAPSLPDFHVGEAVLFRSTLSRSGALHEPVSRAKLG